MGNAFDELLSGYNHPNRCSDRVDGQRESGINRNTDASVPKINWTRRSLELVNSGYLVEMFTHDNKLIAQPWRVYLESGCRDAIPPQSALQRLLFWNLNQKLHFSLSSFDTSLCSREAQCQNYYTSFMRRVQSHSSAKLRTFVSHII